MKIVVVKWMLRNPNSVKNAEWAGLGIVVLVFSITNVNHSLGGATMIVKQKPMMVELTLDELQKAVWTALQAAGVSAPAGVRVHSMCPSAPAWLTVGDEPDRSVLSVEILGTGLLGIERGGCDDEPITE